MKNELPFDGYFDLTLHKQTATKLQQQIATEGLSLDTYNKCVEFSPEAFNTIAKNKVTALPSKNQQDIAIEAFDSLMGLMPLIRAHETDGIVTVTGIPTNLLVTHIYKHWNTSRIAKNIILDKGMRYFKFYSFYAIEIVYMLETIIPRVAYRASMIRDIIKAIKENTWLANIEQEPVAKFNYQKLEELNCTLLPNQMAYLKEYEEKTAKYSLDGYVLAAPPGTGKALKNGTLVKTQLGWTAIEKLCVGDKVIGRDGKPTTVTGVYPQGEVELFEITFIDGRKIVACKDHQWRFYDALERKWLVDSTYELIRRLNTKTVLFIPLIENYGQCNLNAFIRNLNVYSNGINRVNNSFYIDVAKEDEAQWFINTARALGGIASSAKTTTGFRVTIRHPNPALLGFNQLPKRKLNLLIKNIRPVDNDQATCISVDNEDRLFVVEDYIVTHNTINGFAMSLVSGADTTIFIVPNNSVEDVWESTLLTRFKRQKTYWTSHQNKPITGKEDYLIGHYESLKNIINAVNKLGNRKVYIWLDESHNFNELSSARTQMFVDLCKKVNLVGCTWASGTPFKAIGKEAVPMLRCIDKQFTPKVEQSFIKIFGATKGQALDILANRMGKVMFKVPKLEVVSNERLEFVQPVQFDGMFEYTLDKIGKDLIAFISERHVFYKEHMPEYVDSFNNIIELVRPRIKDGASVNRFSLYLAGVRKMHQRFDPQGDKDLVVSCNLTERELIYPLLSNEERKEFKRVASVYKYVVLTVRGEALGRILTRARIDCFNAMVPHANLKSIIETARKKTLIFTSYVEVADKLKAQVEADGFKPLIVYGETNKNLPAIMAEFKRNPDANPLIATFDSLSTAVPVIEASTVVMFNAPFRDYIRDQAVSRADRLGQDGAVTVANILLDTGKEENISTRSKDIMQWSKEQVDAIMQLN